eukprot:COSAG01_NODE_1147_length_11515_cov_38.979694_4_plen_84_part_00
MAATAHVQQPSHASARARGQPAEPPPALPHTTQHAVAVAAVIAADADAADATESDLQGQSAGGHLADELRRAQEALLYIQQGG